jgi:predicted GIY-YIG superfamily endonuclease
MPNYNQSKIYKIIDNKNNEVYIGSTTQYYLQDRIRTHKSKTKLGKNGCMSRYIIERGDWRTELIENYSCNNIQELNEREQYWIDKIDCINKYKAKYETPFDSKEWNRKSRKLHSSWGNLLKINVNLFL